MYKCTIIFVLYVQEILEGFEFVLYSGFRMATMVSGFCTSRESTSGFRIPTSKFCRIPVSRIPTGRYFRQFWSAIYQRSFKVSVVNDKVLSPDQIQFCVVNLRSEQY